MEIERIDFRDSLKILAEETWVDITQYQKDPEKQKAKSSAKEKLKLLNKRTQSVFQQYFIWSDADVYVREKRWLSDATIELFGIWYAPDSYDLTMQFLREKWFTDADLIDAWLAKQWKHDKAFAFFRHRLTFPIYDHIWNIVWFGWRALSAEQTPKYLNTTETELYQKSKILYGLHKAKNHLKEFGGLVIVEWYMDVIALAQYGLPTWIATCGTALTTQHTKLIKRHSDHLVFAFDHDGAWFEATIRWLKVAYEQDLFPKVFIFPDEYKDVDERLQKTDTWEVIHWKSLLSDSTKDGFEWALQEYEKRVDQENPVERKKVMQSLFEMLSKIEDYAVMQLYFTKVVDFFWLSEQMLWKQFRSWLKKGSARKRPVYKEHDADEKDLKTLSKIEDKYLLSVLFYNNFARTRWVSEDLYTSYAHVLRSICEIYPDSLLWNTFSGSLDASMHEKLSEAELYIDTSYGELDKNKVFVDIIDQRKKHAESIMIKKAPSDKKGEVLKLFGELKRMAR